MKGRHTTTKKTTDPTYSAEWSGVTYAPECHYVKCNICGGHTHHEGGSHYCPSCDDYRPKTDKRCNYD